MHRLGGPRSATYPSSGPALSPGYARHARSVSTSPQTTSTALFSDFKCLKEKLAQKRSASSTRTRSTTVRQLEIGSPVLISTTAEDVSVIPLSALHPPPRSAPMHAPHHLHSASPPVTARLREFSPLGSHPVVPTKDHNPTAPVEQNEQIARPRSQSDVSAVHATGTPVQSSAVRANSSETRRTKVFSNEPWIQSPRFAQPSNLDEEHVRETSTAAAVLERPPSSLELPSLDTRPTSSHGGNRTLGLRMSALGKNKELPPLPRYVFPAPLFACATPSSSSPTVSQDPKSQEEKRDENSGTNRHSESTSHFSMWSTESVRYSSPISDDGAVHSPTFSSLTSDCSDLGSPKRHSARFSISDYMDSPDYDSAAPSEELNDASEEEEAASSHLSANPPQLDELRISTFGSTLFDLDLQHGGAGSRGSRGSRRQVACFGFQGYKLPEDEATSKVTITEPKLRPEPSFKHDRGSSVSQMETLVNEFGFLGESVL
jgi:hypothetical protein